MNDIPDFLRKSLANSEVIPLIGAGVSMSVKMKEGGKAFPSWSELLCNAADELEGKDSEVVKLQVEREKLQRAAQEAQELLSGRPWFEFLNSQFSIDFTQLDDSCKALPKAIWKLSNRVVTLNYDKVLEWAHEESANVCAFDNSNHEQLAEFARVSNKEMLWHLHGKIEHPKHMVLTPQSYHRLYHEGAEEHYKAALTKFRELISTKTLLFIGCSLDDAELLAELVKQNKLFDGNTGPHYALVREKDRQTIDQKLADIDIKTVPFSEFGQPLIDAVQRLVECKIQHESKQTDLKVGESSQQADKQPKKYDKISLFTASPLDKPIDESNIIAKLKKFKYPIYQQAFTERNLMEADDYSILFLLAKKTSNGLLIEDDNASSDYLAIEELKDNLPINAKIMVLITNKNFTEQELSLIDFPLIVISLLGEHGNVLKSLDKLSYQLFKKQDVSQFIDKKYIQIVNVTNEILQTINPENNQEWLNNNIILPREICSVDLQGFTGRLSDLADISAKLSKATNRKRLLTIKGSGGLGKTTIAKKIALELAHRGHYNAGVYFIDCENISSLNQLEMHIGGAFNLQMADDLFGYLAKHCDKKSRLLIFDNLESLLYLRNADRSQNKQAVEQVKKILSQTLLYATVLVTSRESINSEWEDIYPFREMESEEALSLFNHLTNDNYIKSSDQEFARRKILEPLLNNNPLAIKLICDGMPKGKNLKELKRELEDDFFDKVKEAELTLMFDDEADSNINRQESLYVSILYSYKTLSDRQKSTFESFSLFPDGIDLGTFKRLVEESKKSDRNKDVSTLKKTINDNDIKVLTDKSLIESNHDFYKLQSVIHRFARFQFEQHIGDEDKSALYRQALRYNYQIMSYIEEINHLNRRAISIFFGLFNNLIAAISYGEKKSVIRSREELEDYIEMTLLIGSFSDEVSLSSDFLSVVEPINIEEIFEDKDDKEIGLVWKLIKISAMYYKGNFDSAFNQLKSIIPKEYLMNIYHEKRKDNLLKNLIIGKARSIYIMEGEAFDSLLYDIKFDRYRFVAITPVQEHLALNVEPLMNIVIPDQSYFEVQAYLKGAIDPLELDQVIDNHHESEHLSRITLTYIKSREFYVSFESIEKLVSVNPYTRGLKNLMYAFAFEHDLIKTKDSDELNELIIKHYRAALSELEHIKFYYTQAYYFYANFLSKIEHPDYYLIYRKGLSLTQKHYYRYWQHRFLLLENPNLGEFKTENYPLPIDFDMSVLIEKQAKWIKNEFGNSLTDYYRDKF